MRTQALALALRPALALCALGLASAAASAAAEAHRAGARALEERAAEPARPRQASAQSGEAALAEVSGDALSSERREASLLALERGLEHLARRQAEEEDGSLGGRGTQAVPVATAALASLAWMAAGSGPERGPRGRALARSIDYLLAHADLTQGSPVYGYVSAPNAIGKMHAHGYATLALAEAYSMSSDTLRGQRIAGALSAGVDLIERTQGAEGGWWYDPERTTQHENSITITLVQALRAAHNVGVRVDPAVIARAVDYVKRTQNEDGSFRYGLEHPSTTVAISAAAISTLNATGEYDGPSIAAGIEWIWGELDLRAGGGSSARFPYYERLYLAQALWQNPDPRVFERWYDEELMRVIATQAEDGSWSDETYGDAYATAMNCLVLAVPLGWLPIFQR